MPDRELFVGLLSGTSVDAIDAALVAFEDASIRVLHTLAAPIPDDLKSRLLELTEATEVCADEIGHIDRQLGICLGTAALSLIDAAAVSPRSIRAIGSHGQTIRHRPRRAGVAEHGFSWQIGDPNSVAEITGITTVADFRRRDVAAGGQGAPLVPAFHNWLYRSAQRNRAVLNIGGMANVSLLPADSSKPVLGYDTGPGNALMDAWNRRHHQTGFDASGRWARSGRVDPGLLAAMLSHPFFSRPAPKSTGREEFNLQWLEQMPGIGQVLPADVQATLAEFTARSIAQALLAVMPDCEEVFVCGGGVHNDHLVERLAALMLPRKLASTAVLGLDPDWVEAGAFAWLARQTLAGLAGNLPAVTGARHPVVLGAIYPAAL